METLKLDSLLGPELRCIAMGCMLSMPGSVNQNFHQDGPHLNDPEGDYTEAVRQSVVEAAAPAPAAAGGSGVRPSPAAGKKTGPKEVSKPKSKVKKEKKEKRESKAKTENIKSPPHLPPSRS